MVRLLKNLAGYRKVLITLVCFLSSIALLVFKIINADQWVELNKFVLPSFMAANLMEAFIVKKEVSSDDS